MPSPHSLPSTYTAWVCRRYGGPDVLERVSRPRPELRPDEVLVRVHATTVSSGDARLRALRLPRGFGVLGRPIFGFRRPRQPILGTEFSGTVAAVGGEVTAWRVGDEVVGFPGAAMGCHAEYRVVSSKVPLIPQPASLTFAEAAALCFGGTTALHFLRRAELKAGERVLVIGAAGAVGSAMVQIARDRGARVTAVVGARNLELARTLGAAEVIDYSSRDYTKEDSVYDVVADTVGALTFRRCVPLLREHGRYLAINADLPGMFARSAGTKRSLAGPASERLDDVRELGRLAAAGVFRPVIDAIFPFDRLPEAHARVDTGHKRGSAVVQLVAD